MVEEGGGFRRPYDCIGSEAPGHSIHPRPQAEQIRPRFAAAGSHLSIVGTSYNWISRFSIANAWRLFWQAYQPETASNEDDAVDYRFESLEGA